MGPSLRIVHREDVPGVRTVAPVGCADMDTAPLLREALEDALSRSPSPTTVVVDCSGLTFCASAGLNEFLRARRTAVGRGVALCLSAPPEQLQRLLRVTEADTVLDVRPAPGTVSPDGRPAGAPEPDGPES
jgi:anti-anti-sigma factor